MFAAILAVPWSMLAASFLPPFPGDWPVALGLAARLGLLALFMLLNAAIVRGIAARSERDLARLAARTGVLVLLAAMLANGCMLTSRQVTLVAAPTGTSQLFSGGVGTTILSF